jgi:HK97 family phage prohead protease
MATPEKYSHIDFTPPQGVKKEAEYGLKLRREYGRGGTAVGIARARDLANGVKLSPSTLRRMKAFFDRHQSDEKAEGFFKGDKGWPSNGLIANKLWGGPNGYAWARKVVEQMNAADEKEGRDLRPYGSSHGMKPNVYVVHGAPGSGKQDYVAKHKGENDVVFDFYKVMSALSGGGRNEKLVSYCLDIRNLILKKALSGSNDCKTWIITTNVSDEMKRQLSDIPTKYVHVESTKDECLRRIEGEPDAEELRKVIEEYFAEERRATEPPGVERRFLGNFSHVEKADPELLRVERRADPSTGKPRTYVVGYAARFHKDSLLLGDFVERIAPEAFDIVEKREDSEGQPLQTRCLFNHSPDHLLGRFPTTMRLIVDTKGLKYECLLPESRQDLAELIERGDLRGSSFSFVVADGGEKWTTENGRSIRTVTKIKSLLDCGPVTYPAYGDSTVAVAKRSYQHFVAEGVKKVESRSEIKERAAIVKKEMAEFLTERRAFCPTGEGGGLDNSCGAGGGKGSAKKEPSPEAEKESFSSKASRIGAVMGAAGGLAGGVAGVVGGAAGGWIGGKVFGSLIDAAVSVAEFFGNVNGPKGKRYQAIKESAGVSDEQIKKVADIMTNGEVKYSSFAADGKTLMIETHNGGHAFITASSIFGDKPKGASVFFSFQDGGTNLDTVEKSAKALNAKHVAVEAWRDEDVKTLSSKGYKLVAKSPGGYSSSKGVFEKKISRPKTSRRSASVARETVAFLKARRG